MASFGLVLDDVTGNFVGSDPPESSSSSSPHRAGDVANPHSSHLQGGGDSKLFEAERVSNSGSGYASLHDSSLRSESKNSREKDRKTDREHSSDSKAWAASGRTRDSPAPPRRNEGRPEDTPVIARSSSSSQQGKDRAGAMQGTPGRGATPPAPIPNVPVSTPSEAKTPLARHGRSNSSSSSVLSSPPPCIPPSPPPQLNPQTTYMPSSEGRGNMSSGSGKTDSANQALLTPVPAPPPNVHAEYSESPSDDVDRIQSAPSSLRNGSFSVDKNNKKASDRVEKEVEAEDENNFLGSYDVPVSLWSVGLQLDVASLLTHASDSQVD
jgi:hypothetical protein